MQQRKTSKHPPGPWRWSECPERVGEGGGGVEGWRAAEGAERFLIVSTGDIATSRHSSAVSPAPKFSPGGSAFASNCNPSRKKF